MSALVIKNLPEDLHNRLKARAARNHRSLTKEAIALLEAGVSRPSGASANLSDPLDALDALAAAGKAMLDSGVDMEAWAARSRDVWR
jgi:plasmid stability protein